MPTYRDALPQLDDRIFLADGGIETDLIFHRGIDLPHFAAFVLLADEAGRDALRSYFRPYLAIARDAGVGLVLETPTWRASPDWGALLGYPPEALDAANREAVELLVELRAEQPSSSPVVVSGCVGPRGDGYFPETLMSAEQAQDYHSAQVDTFSRTEADLVTAITMTHTGEALGITRAAAEAGVPAVISFTVETDGRLPSGERLGEVIQAVDEATGAYPRYYMVNCAHPTHFEGTFRKGSGWQQRIRGIRANASTMTHAELDAAEELDEGDPADLAARYAALREDFSHLTVLGGCCGTDARHIDAIRRAVLA